MRIKDVIRANKKNIRYGGWKNGAMPKSVFPLGKSGKNALNLKSYDWFSISFTTDTDAYRVVIAVHFQKQAYYAHLGQVSGSDTKALLSYEFHSSHGGWHVHAGCGDIDLIPIGRYKGPWKVNIPRHWQTCRDMEWGISDKPSALVRACKKFGIPLPNDKNSQLSLIV